MNRRINMNILKVKGALYEKKFRTWILAYLGEHKTIELGDAVNSGTEIAGCSQQSKTKYLKRMTDVDGQLRVQKGDDGERIIVLRDKDHEKS